MENQTQFLFLASGVKDGEGFWFVGVKNCDENILDDENLLDCHRKELIGIESAKDILYAINLNINNLLEELKEKKYLIDNPPFGIPFNIPLAFLENIFDFWLEIYKEKVGWVTCLGLLKTRKRLSLSTLIKKGILKGNSKKWAIDIEALHSFIPNSIENRVTNEPMWK